jgi:glycosyltransferase involved in cell wall biosynthesis
VSFRQPGYRGRRGRILRGLRRELLYFPIQLPIATYRSRLDLLHCPSPLAPLRSPVPLVITVADVMAWEHPEWLTRANVLQNRLVAARAIRSAAMVLTHSQFSRGKIIELFGLEPERVAVVPHGVAGHFRPGPCSEGELASLGVTRPYLLAVGTDRRKNLETAVAAAARLASADLPHLLVIVGPSAGLGDRLASCVDGASPGSRVLLAGQVSDQQLVQLYRGAECVVHVSLYEGFGLPLLEAMACGTPVIAAACTGMPEALGDAGLLVEPHDVGGLERALVDILSSPGRREQFSARGLARARTFTWKRCAQLTVEAYMRALDMPQSPAALPRLAAED